MNNTSCINLIIIIISPNNFQNNLTFCTGLSDFHKLVMTVLKTFFRKTAPKEFHYRGYNKFNADDFKTELKKTLATSSTNYKNFEQIFLALLDKHALYKNKTVTTNQVLYITKNL